MEQILSINKMFLSDVEKAYAEGPNTKIGPCFKQFAPFLIAYTTYVLWFSNIASYVNNYDNSNELFTSIEKDKQYAKIKEFFQEQYKNPKTEKHKFDSFAILPIQRIPRML